jgi:FKBP-type peptidyl-prolyl cis-trans isomerase
MARNKDKRNKGSKGFHGKAGNNFLEKNAQKEGIITANSGLQYMIIKKGDGIQPEENDLVTVHQRALLLNGKVLTDTYKKNETDQFKVSDALEGLKEGLLLMNEGSRYKFFIPPELAWGEKGSSNRIPPNAVIIFDVHIISVEFN